MAELDARDLPDGANVEADVCIVGGGPAGIAMALDLAGAGVRVTVLESGGHERDEAIQELYAGDNVGQHYVDLDLTRLRFLGGSTNHWEGYSLPMDARDLAVAPSAEMSGWPLEERDLAVHYERVHELCQLGPVDYDPARWSRETGTELLDLDGGTVVNGMTRRSPPTRFGERYGEQLAASDDIELYLHANVVDIRVAEGRTHGVRLAHLDGSTQRVNAPVVVVATGGLENPRLLLASTDDRGRQLGNASDMVGRCFMEHPHVTAGYLLTDENLDLSFYAENQPVGEAFVKGLLKVTEETREARGIGNLAGLLLPPLGVTQEDILAIPGAAGVRHLQSLFGQGGIAAYRLNLMTEQRPHLASRVELSDRVDALGMPRIQLNWYLDAADERTIRVGTEILAAALGSNGIGRVHSLVHGPRSEIDLRWGNHHMGTTRMSEDPNRGVVDADGRVHDVEGLYVAGSSTFPTGGFANPTLSLLSLALRLSTHLRREVV